MKSKAGTLLLLLSGLIVTGYTVEPLAAPAWAAMQAKEPALRVDLPAAAVRQAVVVALLGGFRSATADLVWLKTFEAAENRDLPATESLLNWVTEIDPRPLYFWVNGARITAYDMPGWRIAAEGGYDRVPLATQAAITHEQAGMALRRLDQAARFHPTSAVLWIERANIELSRLGDMAAAAESYRRAWEQPGAPYYAARLHAELLRRLGRKTEALDWLVKLHPQLPAGDESAGAELVLARIRDLERELGVPEGQTYRYEGGKCLRRGTGLRPVIRRSGFTPDMPAKRVGDKPRPTK